MRFDESLAFKRDPYRFIAKRCRQIASDVYETRLFLRKTTCVTERAADGAAHQHRKAMFLALMSSARVRELAEIFRNELRLESAHWQSQETIVLYDALQPVLTRAVCKWSGVPLTPREIPRRSKQLTALFDAAGRFPAHFKSRLDRMRAEDWAAGLIENVRLGAIMPPAQSALREIALHRDLDGQLLTAHTAAVELLNVLRPTVAASVYIVFCAHALHQFPAAAEGLRTGGQPYMDAFISEVRQRFLQWNGDAHSFVPQGGGSHQLQHRCPGEWITVALMRTAIDFLTETIGYNVPEQDLRVDTSRLPALPRSRFVINAVHKRAHRAAGGA